MNFPATIIMLCKSSASYVGTFTIWNPLTGEELLERRDSKRAIRSICWSPDGQFLACGGDENRIHLWETIKWNRVRELPGHEVGNEVRALAWSPDGKWLASAGSDKQCILWDPASGEQVHALKGYSASVVALAWNPESTRLATASFDGSVKIWSIYSPRSGDSQNAGEGIGVRGEMELRGHAGAVLSLSWRPGGDRLASGGYDTRIWETGTGQQALTLKGHTNVVQRLAWSPDGKRLASCSWDHTVRIWDATLGYEQD